MGIWGYYPWETDLAADWFDEAVAQTGLADLVGATVRKAPSSWEKIRAAGYVLIHLGRVGIWPTERLEADLTAAVEAFEEMLQLLRAGDPEDEFIEPMSMELERLRARLQELRPSQATGP